MGVGTGGDAGGGGGGDGGARGGGRGGGRGLGNDANVRKVRVVRRNQHTTV